MFHWTYRPNGPLFVNFSITTGGTIKLGIFVKHYDRWCRHNNFIDISEVNVKEAITLLDQGHCPYCRGQLFFKIDDKYNHTDCPKCEYSAWSNKIYDQDDF